MSKLGVLILFVGLCSADSQFIQIPTLLVIIGAALIAGGAHFEKSNNH